MRMGLKAKASYVEARQQGDDDIMSIMMRVSTDLEQNWAEYNADAFVNAWDIGNYVSDYLIQVSGNESCECSTEVH